MHFHRRNMRRKSGVPRFAISAHGLGSRTRRPSSAAYRPPINADERRLFRFRDRKRDGPGFSSGLEIAGPLQYTMEPTISVIIPAYNAAQSIAAAVRSAWDQKPRPSEVIVVDDGSTDDTAAVVSGLPIPVKLLSQANQGAGQARNAGVTQAKGEWLAFLDADDVWLPGKLEKQGRYTGDPSVAVINCRAKTKQGGPVASEISLDRLWEANDLITSSVLVRRSAFLAAGGFDANLDLAEDHDLWFRLAAGGWTIVNCPEDLVLYCPPSGSLTNQLERFASAHVACLRKAARFLHFPESRLRRRLAQANLDFARSAIFARNMALARRFARRSIAFRLSFRHLKMLAVASLPIAVLDFRRRLLARR